MAIPLPGTPIIIDIGSMYVKIGFAGEPSPRFVFPCITGTEKYKAVLVDVGARNIYVGNDCERMRGVLKIKYPIQRGAIMDWDSYYEILNYIFYTLLRIDNLYDYPVFYTEAPFVQKETKEYIARVLFETHRVKSLMMMPTPLLSIFSVGLTSGLVIESGDGLTWIVPVINGKIIHQAVQKLNLAGIDVNQNLKNLMMREGISIASSAADEIVREIKEKNCYFLLDPKKTTGSTDTLSYSMPDGSNIRIPNHVLYEAPEVLFNPSILGYGNVMSVQEAVIACLRIMDKQYWSELLSHIVFSGGNLSYSGFQDRFEAELDTLLPQLGPIPKPVTAMSVVKSELIKLQAIEIKKKKADTCPQCGAYVDLSTGLEYCPSCNARMVVPEFKIGPQSEEKNLKKKEGAVICPHCKNEIMDSSSVFCPYCGRAIEALEEVEAPKKTKRSAAQEFSEFFESANKILRFYVPDNLQYSIFNGAAILGSLPSFLKLFITHEQFQSNVNLLYRDISEIL
ncbi:MAG: hypothetical protein ACFFA6_00775 [Promethearchaeota archaeon]